MDQRTAVQNSIENPVIMTALVITQWNLPQLGNLSYSLHVGDLSWCGLEFYTVTSPIF